MIFSLLNYRPRSSITYLLAIQGIVYSSRGSQLFIPIIIYFIPRYKIVYPIPDVFLGDSIQNHHRVNLYLPTLFPHLQPCIGYISSIAFLPVAFSIASIKPNTLLVCYYLYYIMNTLVFHFDFLIKSLQPHLQYRRCM